MKWSFLMKFIHQWTHIWRTEACLGKIIDFQYKQNKTSQIHNIELYVNCRGYGNFFYPFNWNNWHFCAQNVDISYYNTRHVSNDIAMGNLLNINYSTGQQKKNKQRPFQNFTSKAVMWLYGMWAQFVVEQKPSILAM